MMDMVPILTDAQHKLQDDEGGNGASTYLQAHHQIFFSWPALRLNCQLDWFHAELITLFLTVLTQLLDHHHPPLCCF